MLDQHPAYVCDVDVADPRQNGAKSGPCLIWNGCGSI